MKFFDSFFKCKKVEVVEVVEVNKEVIPEHVSKLDDDGYIFFVSNYLDKPERVYFADWRPIKLIEFFRIGISLNKYTLEDLEKWGEGSVWLSADKDLIKDIINKLKSDKAKNEII